MADNVPPVTVQIKYDGAWQDITDDVNAAEDLKITRGRADDEAAHAEPGTCTVRFNNTDGKFSPRNAYSPLHGKIGRNTPIRVRVPSSSSAGLDLPGTTNSWAQDGFTNVAGDLDVRVEMTPQSWRPTASQMVASKWVPSGTLRAWTFILLSTGLLELSWSPDGTLASRIVRTSTVAVPATGGQLAVRAVLDINNGSGQHVVTFYTAPSMDGAWTQLGAAVTGAGTTSVFAVGSNTTIGAASDGGVGFTGISRFVGRVHRFELRDGTTVIANPDFTTAEPESTTFTDSGGRVWTLGPDATIVNPAIRFRGVVPSWPTRWTGPEYASVPVEAKGELRRLGQGSTPLRSAMFRGLTGANRPAPLAYWPCEDEEGATRIASGLSGGEPMTITGAVKLADYSEFSASEPVPTFTTGSISGRVAGTTSNYLRVMALVKVPDNPLSADTTLITLVTSGVAARWYLDMSTTGALKLRATTNFGVSLLDSGWFTLAANGGQYALGIYLIQNGANVDWQIFSYQVGATQVFVGSATLTATTFGRALNVSIGGYADLGSTAVGHVLVLDNDQFWDMLNYVKAWTAETAGDRIVRLCGEQGVPLEVVGTPSDTAPMGAQLSATFVGLLQDAETADLGILAEPPDSDGLWYRTHRDLYNQDPVLALDYREGEVAPPFEPTDDDQATRNDVTVSRQGGSSERYIRADGAMSVQDPPDGVGRYDESVTVNLDGEYQLLNQASWRVHLGTVDEPRYPSITVDLAVNPDLAEAAMAVRLGDKIRILNPPVWLPPGPIDQIVQGISEQLNALTWTITFTCTPASPWDVAIVEDATFGRLDTSGSILASAVTATDTVLVVDATSGPAWTTAAGDLPFDIEIDDEVMTVTAVANALSDTFTRTVSNGWGTADTGQAWTTSGGAASDYAVGSGVATVSLSAVNSSRWITTPLNATTVDFYATVKSSVVAAGAPVVAWLLGRYVDQNNWYAARVVFNTNSTVTIEIWKDVAGTEANVVSSASLGSYTAGQTWRARFQIDGNMLRAKAWPTSGSEPLAWSVALADTSLTAPGGVGIRTRLNTGNTNTLPVTVTVDDIQLVRPQRFTVTRGVNGIAIPHTVGADVALAHPAIIGL